MYIEKPIIMKIFWIAITIFVIICILSWIIDTHRFVIRHYEIHDKKINGHIRFALLTDLHNKEYGKDNVKLLKAIDDCKPDAILIAGDICNGLKNSDFSPALNFISELSKKYVLYYGMGNHEYRLRRYPDVYGDMWEKYSAELSKIGVSIMDNEKLNIDNNIVINSVTIDRAFYKRFKHNRLEVSDMEEYLGKPQEDKYQILIAHNPEYFKTYSGWGADLTVSGHVHGGIMRLPFLGGIISPRLIEFPKYDGGMYSDNDKKMIVSCGLGTHTLHVRVFNPAELAIIDLDR